MRLSKMVVTGGFLAVMTSVSQAESVNEDTLKRNMAYGQLINLNQYSPNFEKNLMLRLFASADQGESCGLESGGLCKNAYILTSATFDELPDVQIYRLQAKGEFVSAVWSKPKDGERITDRARLIMTFRTYHRFATRSNPQLKKEMFQIEVSVSPEGIQEKNLPGMHIATKQP